MERKHNHIFSSLSLTLFHFTPIQKQSYQWNKTYKNKWHRTIKRLKSTKKINKLDKITRVYIACLFLSPNYFKNIMKPYNPCEQVFTIIWETEHLLPHHSRILSFFFYLPFFQAITLIWHAWKLCSIASHFESIDQAWH